MEPTLDSPFPKFQRFLPGDETPLGVMHVVDRIVGRQFLLGPEEKDHLARLLDSLLGFSGLELITWTCLDNHYHLLLRVPNPNEAARLRDELNEQAIFERMKGSHSQSYLKEVKWRIEAFRRKGNTDAADLILRRLRAQMFDISAFMQMFKRRFSAWYNKKHGRKGTLWEGPFGSTLVEPNDKTVARVAAYIDLNPVRAGIVTDPKDYRWGGYGQAVAGVKRARNALRELVAARCQSSKIPSWAEARGVYGEWLYDEGLEKRDESGKIVRKGITQAEVDRVRARRGRLTLNQLLHCRVRYFSDGLAIGSRAFVEAQFQRYRPRFGERRKTGARPMRHGAWSGLCTLRDLRKDVIRASGGDG